MRNHVRTNKNVLTFVHLVILVVIQRFNLGSMARILVKISETNFQCKNATLTIYEKPITISSIFDEELYLLQLSGRGKEIHLVGGVTHDIRLGRPQTVRHALCVLHDDNILVPKLFLRYQDQSPHPPTDHESLSAPMRWSRRSRAYWWAHGSCGSPG